MQRIRASLQVAVIALSIVALTSAQQKPAAPTLDQLASYETFRSWLIKQPAEIRQAADDVLFQHYAEELRRQGKSDEETASTIATLKKLGNAPEVERWNRILTSPKPMFNVAPNAFLVEMTKGLKPGRALDVGMGQGRNTIYLAQQGWDSVGFDPADRGRGGGPGPGRQARRQDNHSRRSRGRL